LAGIWAEVLKLERVGRQDNFFELGGHSLLAVRVVALLERIGIRILTDDLFAHPTILSLSQKLGEKGYRVSLDEAICVRSGASEPLFLTHEGRGQIRYVQTLTPYIDAGIPVYALPAVEIDKPPLHTVEEMARRMVQMIRAVQPNGPHRIAGFSFGALLAYEIAAQLIAAGQAVNFLGLLDAPHPECAFGDSQQHEWTLVRMDHNLTDDEKQITRMSVSATGDVAEFVQQYCKMLHLEPTRQLTRYLARAYSYFRAAIQYRPSHLPVPTYVFVSQEHDLVDSLGWDKSISNDLLRLRRVAGTHHTMMSRPNVEALGRILSEAIRDTS
jgi:thioesterase domain-containing protein